MAGHMVDSDVMIYTEHVHRYLLLDHSGTGTGNGTRASAHARDALGMPSELAPRRRRWGERADEEMRPWWTVAEVAAALLETAAAARRGLGLTRTEPLQPLEPWAPKHAIAFVLVPLRPRDGWLKSAPAGAGGQSHLPSGKRAQTSACLLRPLRSLCAANSGRHVVHTVLAVQQGFPALRATSHYPQLGCTALVPGTASAGLPNTSPAAFTGTCCRSSLRAPRRHNALANLSGSLCSVTLSSSNVMEPEHAGSPCARSSKLCLLHPGPRSGAVTLMPNSAKKKNSPFPSGDWEVEAQLILAFAANSWSLIGRLQLAGLQALFSKPSQIPLIIFAAAHSCPYPPSLPILSRPTTPYYHRLLLRCLPAATILVYFSSRSALRTPPKSCSSLYTL